MGTETGFLQVSVEPELPIAANDLPLYHLPDFHIDIILATRKTLQMERDASNSSTTTAYYADAESTTAYDSEDMTKYTSLSRRSASPSSYLSAIAASIMPRKMFPLPTGGHESLLCNNYPDHTSRKTGKALRLERQYSREQRMFRFSCMSYDQKIAEIERSLRWMRAHSRRV
ncbi:hypothetical protein DFH29DRAFT_946706 [Suillus ampliporus]|nr:hypothetical protein DFH29DRAFT_946706 [Suillus ampliporus]